MSSNHEQKVKKVAYYGVFVTLALVASYVETLIPISYGVPGAKLGLANLVTIIALFVMSWKDAAVISILRIVLSGFLFGNLFAIFYSLAGAVLSLIVMVILKKLKFGTVGVSAAGGIAHNIGQLAFASLIVENTRLFYYLPILLFAGIGAGFLIGILGGKVIERLPHI